MKFVGRIGNQNRDIAIFQMAIKSGYLEIPDGVSVEQLINYSKDKIPQLVNRLHQNSQILAWRNWIGKKYRL